MQDNLQNINLQLIKIEEEKQNKYENNKEEIIKV